MTGIILRSQILLLWLIVHLSWLRVCEAYSPRTGSNICGISFGETRCCPGWTKSLNGLCTTAICDGNCGERGSCIAPNQCRCKDGLVKEDCTTEDDFGYLADEPVRCPSNCNDQGECTNGKCICNFGFKGSACDEEDLGPCFIQIERGICSNAVTSDDNKTALLTQSACCGSIGAAWGHSCRVCSSLFSYCTRGYANFNRKCEDINECEIPKVCAGGICRNIEGSFECDCPYGYAFDKDTVQCQPVLNGCQTNPEACSPGGRCIPLHDTSYTCQCDPGYTAVNGNTRCQKEEVALNYCEVFEGRLCKNGECNATPSSYECTCNPGYTLSRFKKQCIKEFNACTLYGSSVCLNGKCMPVGRSFRCICKPGYVLSPDGTSCHDKCQQLGSSICQNGFCVPRPYGDYECRCHYDYLPSPDRKSCLPPANSFQYSKQESWNNSSNFRASYQADWPQENKASYSELQPVKPKLQSFAMINNYPNPCGDISLRKKCKGGFCLNVGRGLYECKCYSGYRAVNADQQCVVDYNRISSHKDWPFKTPREKIN